MKCVPHPARPAGWLISLFVLGVGTPALADGIPFKGDRYAGKATVLLLTPEQLLQARACGRVNLTGGQRRKLAGAAGFSPRVLMVWSLKDAGNTCTCELYNMGIHFGPWRLEVPHAYLERELDHPVAPPAAPVTLFALVGLGAALGLAAFVAWRRRCARQEA